MLVLLYPVCPFLSVKSCLSFPECPLLPVSIYVCPFLSDISCLFSPVCPFLSVLRCMSFPVCSLLAFYFRLSSSGFVFCLSKSVYRLMYFLACLSSSRRCILSGLSCLSSPVCPRLSYLSSRVFTLLSLLFCFLFLSVLSCLSTSVSRRLSFLDYRSSTVRPLLGLSPVCHLTMSSSVLSIFLSCLSFLSVLFSAFHIVCPSWLYFSVLYIFLSCLSFLSVLFSAFYVYVLSVLPGYPFLCFLSFYPACLFCLTSPFNLLISVHLRGEETESRQFSLNFLAHTGIGRKQKVVNSP